MDICVNENIGKCNCNYAHDEFEHLPKSGNFFFCSIEEARYLQTMGFGVVSYDEDVFKVSQWLPAIGENALNWEGSYYLHALQMSEREIGSFCRSDSGDKHWAGQMIRDDSDIRLIKSIVPVDEMMFVAPRRDVFGEWRIWMINGMCAAGTPYANEFCEYAGHEGCLNDAVDFAVWLANEEFEPDERYVIDVAYTKDGYKVVEYNAYSTSGFYGVDTGRLFDATIRSYE